MKRQTELISIIIGSLITASASVLLAQTTIFAINPAFKTVILIKVFLTSFNAALILGLAINYLKIYNGLKTPLSRSLIVFSTALLFYAATSSPLTHALVGFETISVGAFTFLPDLFVAAATLIILRESYR